VVANSEEVVVEVLENRVGYNTIGIGSIGKTCTIVEVTLRK